MWTPNAYFSKRLNQDLPRWIAAGWVRPEHRQEILDDAATQAGATRRAPLAFAILGVVLFGAGVVLFFAANWTGMAKLTKLLVLLVALWGAYGAAYWFLSHDRDGDNRLGQALLLLGVILFGASIMLVAQAFHISGRFPNSVLLWALGALVVTYLVPNQATAVLGLGLTALWTFLETTPEPLPLPAYIPFAGPVHWPFLVLWGLFLVPLYRRAWRATAGAASLAVIFWGIMTLAVLVDGSGASLAPVFRICLVGGICVFLVGTILGGIERALVYADTVRHQGTLLALAAFYLSTLRWNFGLDTRYFDPSLVTEGAWTTGTLAAVGVSIALAGWQWWRVRDFDPPRYAQLGRGLLAAVLLVVVACVLPDSDQRGAFTALYIAFNLLYLAGLAWIVYAGYAGNSPLLVNSGFLFFGLGVVTLYFDTFLELMNRSFFFMGLGLLLFAGGYLIERQRRRLIGQLGGEGRP